MWNFKESGEGLTKPQILAKVKAELEALVGVVPGLVKAQVGIGVNPQGFDACLCSELESQQALENYKSHPEHLKVSGFIAKVRTERVVCDYEL